MSSLVGAPTGLYVPVVPPVLAPQVTAISGGTIYLRFKRRNQTIFVHCEPQELIGAVKLRLASILKVDEMDIRLYEYLPLDRQNAILAHMESQLRDAAKSKKSTSSSSSSVSTQPKTNLDDDIRLLELPQLDDSKKLWELNIDNDAIIFFVYRTHPNTDWDEWECVAVRGCQEDTFKTLGTSAGQTPGGDGFNPPGTQAAKEEREREEEKKRGERAKQQEKDDEPLQVNDEGENGGF